MSSTAPYILLVDDDANNLLLLEELLITEGYQTRSAQSGCEALSIACDMPPDLILLDVMMPDMDGFQVCHQLRTDPNLLVTPIIFLTALDDDESRLRGLELSGDDYLTKPIQTRLLLAKVANLLKLNQMRSHQSELHLQQQFQDRLKQHMSDAWEASEALTEKFRLFVPEQFLERIAPGGVDSIQLGNATEAEMTVLFCDIREFTAIAENQEAIETFQWLNAFFQQMNDAITSHCGFIDKYLGDSILAVFDRASHHAEDALLAAITMRQTLIEFNQSRQQFNLSQPINIGIGVHTGTALIGTVGSDHRMDSTVIGDVVNTASRLEELTKVYGCQILASHAAIAQLNQAEQFHVRRIDRVMPRGKRQEIDLYEVLGTIAQPIDHRKIAAQQMFRKGVAAWTQGEFIQALCWFQKILLNDPSDLVAQLYMHRCQAKVPSDIEFDCPSLLQS
jgi:two-component system sensor histidine kinase ChiS